jgi:hypothetical protein
VLTVTKLQLSVIAIAFGPRSSQRSAIPLRDFDRASRPKAR